MPSLSALLGRGKLPIAVRRPSPMKKILIMTRTDGCFAPQATYPREGNEDE